MLKIWPMVALGVLGILLAWLTTEFVRVEPFKLRLVIIICVGLIGTLAGYKFSVKT